MQGKVYHHTQDLLKHGYENRTKWRVQFRQHRYGRGHETPQRAKPNRIDNLISHLQKEKRLPIVYFAFGRRRTEELANELAKFNFLDEEERSQLTAIANDRHTACMRLMCQPRRPVPGSVIAGPIDPAWP